jgi:nucleotide-binding universal stress UspA family protein
MSLKLGRVLCPVDFSVESTRAFHHALAFARWFEAEVSVLHVYHTAPNAAPAGRGAAAANHEPLALTDGDREQLAASLRAFIATENGSEAYVEWVLDESADVPAAIASHADMLRADLIVMGTHGRRGFHRLFFGSVAERVLRIARCGVLVVPPSARAWQSQPPLGRRVVCATDFSSGSCGALQYAASIAAHGSAALTLVHVIELPPDMPDLPQADLSAYRAARFAQADTAMTQALACVETACRVEKLVLAGRPSREIVQLAADQDADLIVMGAHGRGAVERLLFGSVTEQVLRRAACPVLTVPLTTASASR